MPAANSEEGRIARTSPVRLPREGRNRGRTEARRLWPMPQDSIGSLARLRALCRRFDHDWDALPDIAAFFRQAVDGEARDWDEPLRRALFEELICIDLGHRWRAAPGASVTAPERWTLEQ